MSTLQDFRDTIEAFLTSTGQNATTFGRQSMKDPGFVFDLRAGRCPSARTIDKVMDYMAQAEQETA